MGWSIYGMFLKGRKRPRAGSHSRPGADSIWTSLPILLLANRGTLLVWIILETDISQRQETEAISVPLRPDNPIGLNLTHRPTSPVKLPRITFPMGGDAADAIDANAGQPVEAMSYPIPEPAEVPVPQMSPQPAPRAAGAPSQVIVYGRSNCSASLAAVQDLIDRQVAFSYIDVGRNPQAMAHLQAICAGEPVVPVIISIGFGGA